MPAEPIVFVVDDDQAVREAMRFRLQSAGLAVAVFGSATEFLDAYVPDQPGCLVLDVRMPGMSGLDLQNTLRENGVGLPVIIITGHGDIAMAVRAVKAGAIDFLPKPLNDQHLLRAIRQALELDGQQRTARTARDALAARFERLTPREREVMDLVVAGNTTKEIAAAFGSSHQAVDAHRARLMHKMHADSVAELVRLAVALQPE